MKATRYSTEFKSSIVALYNEGRSVNSLANEYHLAVQTVTGWVKNLKSIPIALILKIGHFFSIRASIIAHTFSILFITNNFDIQFLIINNY
ncbi:transposase [Weissella paramesenteroides]|uniref:transposase n=1 Tax=Weissella paramesenteroides TaxID=1249 RepID=UPI00385761D4